MTRLLLLTVWKQRGRLDRLRHTQTTPDDGPTDTPVRLDPRPGPRASQTEARVLAELADQLRADRWFRVQMQVHQLVMTCRATAFRRTATRVTGAAAVVGAVAAGSGCPGSAVACVTVGVGIGLLPLVVSARGRP